MTLRLFVLSALIALAACAPPSATPPSTAASATNTASDDAAAPMQSPDAVFLAKAVMFENFEIRAAGIASRQAQRQAVKDYAASESTAHHATLQELTQLAQTNHIPAPSADLDDNFHAYVDMLSRANGASFDSLYQSQQALAYINASGFYEAYANSGTASPLKHWAANRLAALQQGVVNARELAASN